MNALKTVQAEMGCDDRLQNQDAGIRALNHPEKITMWNQSEIKKASDNFYFLDSSHWQDEKPVGIFPLNTNRPDDRFSSSAAKPKHLPDKKQRLQADDAVLQTPFLSSTELKPDSR